MAIVSEALVWPDARAEHHKKAWVKSYTVCESLKCSWPYVLTLNNEVVISGGKFSRNGNIYR